MKNYYNILGVSQNATAEEIKTAYNNIPETLRTSDTIDAYNVLGDVQSRKEYDEKLKTKEEKKSPIKKIAIYAGIIAVFGGSIALANKISNDKNDKNSKVEGTVTPGITNEPEENLPTVTPAPEQDIDEVKPIITPTSTPVPTPIAYEDVKSISSETIDVVVKHLSEEYKNKGFEANLEELKSAILIANIEGVESEELKEIMVNSDIKKEIDNANKFSNSLTTHNINSVYSNDTSKYISASTLCYNETDKKVIEHLDDYPVSLSNSVKNGSLTEKKCSTSLDYLANFYFSLDSLEIGKENISYDDLTVGGKYLSEMCSWPTIALEYTVCGKANKETLNKIAAVQNVAADGIRYMTDLSICAQPKQLTK